MRCTNSSVVGASRSCTEARLEPPAAKCTCVSMKPGTSIAPSASTSRVAGPTRPRCPRRSPTAAMRSPSTATASAQGRSGSPVQTRAPVTTSVAASVAALVAAAACDQRRQHESCRQFAGPSCLVFVHPALSPARHDGGTRMATTRPRAQSVSPEDSVQVTVVLRPETSTMRARSCTGRSIGVGAR